MKSFLKPLLALALTLGLSVGASAQNKQIIIKKEVDESGNVISYDSTVIETSGNIDPAQMEEFKQEMAEIRVEMKQHMAEAREQMEASRQEMMSSMEIMRQEMKTMMDEGFGFDKEDFDDLFDMGDIKSLLDEQMNMLQEFFKSESAPGSEDAETKPMKNEQMY